MISGRATISRIAGFLALALLLFVIGCSSPVLEEKK